MDLVDLMEYELDEIEHTILQRRCRVIRNRVDCFNNLDDTNFRARFRLPKLAVRYIHNLIENQITSNTERNNAVDSMTKLLLTLRFLATGSYIRTIGDFIGVSESTACRNIKLVTEAIARLRSSFIKFPEDLDSLKENFYNIARFPSVIGAIDCTHVNIISPGGDSAESFRNRKSNFSINVQVPI